MSVRIEELLCRILLQDSFLQAEIRVVSVQNGEIADQFAAMRVIDLELLYDSFLVVRQ